jgi:hypothetical protein
LKKRYIIVGFLLHFGLSLGGFVGLYGWAAGVQDGGAAAAPSGWLEAALRYVLLQPLAHWVLEAVAIAWWTWAGLGGVALVFAINSAVVVGAAAVLARTFRSRA